MNNSHTKNAGIALIIFTLLLVITMVAHPIGGNVEYLIRMSSLIVITHAIAILSLPFGWSGFWGLTKKIGTEHWGSVLGFAMVSLGMVAVLIAAAINGLALPMYLQDYKDADTATINAIEPILRYGFTINHAFDYIYTGAFSIAILCWSLAILKTGKLPVWLAWLGIALFVGLILIFASGVAVNSVKGLRIFIAGILGWVLLIAFQLYRRPESQ